MSLIPALYSCLQYNVSNIKDNVGTSLWTELSKLYLAGIHSRGLTLGYCPGWFGLFGTALWIVDLSPTKRTLEIPAIFNWDVLNHCKPCSKTLKPKFSGKRRKRLPNTFKHWNFHIWFFTIKHQLCKYSFPF